MAPSTMSFVTGYGFCAYCARPGGQGLSGVSAPQMCTCASTIRMFCRGREHTSPRIGFMSARPWQAAANRLLDGLHGVFGDRLRSVAAYGAHLDGTSDGLLACLTLVANLTVADLEACADL